jgi:hypothetical protein
VKRVAKIAVIALVLLMLASTAFGAGIILGQAGPALRLSSGLAAEPSSAAHAHVTGPAVEEMREFDTFWQAWDIVHDHFIDRDTLDATDLEYGAIRGMVSALGDEGHTTFLTPEELSRQWTDISGKFTGIGAYVGVKDGLPMIVAPFEGSPAEQAGVRVGDIIMEVDSEDVTTWSINDVVDVIRGEEGTEVVLTVLRPDEGESLEIPITRGEITVPAATWAMVPGTEVAMIRAGCWNRSLRPPANSCKVAMCFSRKMPGAIARPIPSRAAVSPGTFPWLSSSTKARRVRRRSLPALSKTTSAAWSSGKQHSARGRCWNRLPWTMAQG